MGGANRSDKLFAVAWQGGDGAIALYSTANRKVVPQVLRSPGFGGGAVAADIQWSPCSPEQLCCAKEDGVVEVWQLPNFAFGAAAAAGPEQRMGPVAGSQSGVVCTALALNPEAGRREMVLATMPSASTSSTSGGALWMTVLPAPLDAAAASQDRIAMTASDAPAHDPAAHVPRSTNRMAALPAAQEPQLA